MGGSQKSSSSSSETTLTRAQSELLKSREKQYQSYFFPELIGSLRDTQGDGHTSTLARKSVGDANKAFAGANQDFRTLMARRGLEGSGVEAAGLASLANAKSSALADSFMKARLANLQQKNSLLQMGGALAPTPTTAAPMASQSSSSGWSIG